jgi:hypothetical protein
VLLHGFTDHALGTILLSCSVALDGPVQPLSLSSSAVMSTAPVPAVRRSVGHGGSASWA